MLKKERVTEKREYDIMTNIDNITEDRHEY